MCKHVLVPIGFLSQGKKEKLFLMSWCPDDAKVKKKMLYSSSFDALKKALVGVAKYIQVNNPRITFTYYFEC